MIAPGVPSLGRSTTSSRSSEPPLSPMPSDWRTSISGPRACIGLSVGVIPLWRGWPDMLAVLRWVQQRPRLVRLLAAASSRPRFGTCICPMTSGTGSWKVFELPFCRPLWGLVSARSSRNPESLGRPKRPFLLGGFGVREAPGWMLRRFSSIMAYDELPNPPDRASVDTKVTDALTHKTKDALRPPRPGCRRDRRRRLSHFHRIRRGGEKGRR